MLRSVTSLIPMFARSARRRSSTTPMPSVASGPIRRRFRRSPPDRRRNSCARWRPARRSLPRVRAAAPRHLVGTCTSQLRVHPPAHKDQDLRRQREAAVCDPAGNRIAQWPELGVATHWGPRRVHRPCRTRIDSCIRSVGFVRRSPKGSNCLCSPLPMHPRHSVRQLNADIPRGSTPGTTTRRQDY